MRLLRLPAIMLLASLICMEASAAMKYRDYTVRDGLSGSSVKVIFQDSRGLMWFGSWYGISIFDGRSFTNISSSPLEADTISNDVIDRIVEHPDGSIWVATWSGVNRIDPYSLKATRYYLGHEDTPSGISTFIVDIGTGGDVFCSASDWGTAWWDPVEDRMVPFNIKGIESNSFSNIFCNGDSELLVRTLEGISSVRYSLNDGQVSAAVEKCLFRGEDVSGMWKLSDGSFAVLHSGRISVMDRDHVIRGHDIPIPQGTVNDISLAPDGKLCILLGEEHVLSGDPADGSVIEMDDEGLDNVLAVAFGSQGTFWVGIDGLGVRMLYDSNLNFKELYTTDLFGQDGGNIIAAAEDDRGRLVISSLGNGLCFIEKDMSKSLLTSRNGLATDRVFSLAHGLYDGEILAGDEQWLDIITTSGGKNKITRLTDLGGRIYFLFTDWERKCIWAGTYLDGLIRLHYEKDGGSYKVTDLQKWTSDGPEGMRLSDDRVMSMVLDDDEDLMWVGTLGGGLNLLEISSGRIRTFNTRSEECPVSNDDILSLLKSSDGSIWVGTGHGLTHIHCDGQRYHSTFYSTENGLADNSIHAMQEDCNGNIWLSTSRGISCRLKDSGRFVNYNDERLIRTFEYCNHSCTKLSDGYLFFGGIGGGCTFNPDEIRQRTFSPDIIFTSMSVKGEKRAGILPDSDKITLRYDEDQFTISFTALDYINNESCEYRFRLLGFEDRWHDAGTSGTAVYTNVGPGRYTLQVYSTNGDKLQCDNLKELRIRVRQPWWFRGWAIALWSVILLVIAGAITEYYREKKRHKLALEKESSDRERQKETYEAKLRFFTNVAHEFGTPLTLISSSTEQMLESGDSRNARHLKTIHSSASRMQKLIDEIMDFRKVDTGMYSPKYSKFNLKALIMDILENFSDINERCSINLVRDFRTEDELIVSDASAVDKILTNLISNAYKYTPKWGDISVRLSKADGGFEIEVTNSGKGIKKEDLPKVFDRFTILDTFEKQAKSEGPKRNGVGMALVKSLTDMLGGDISVYSEIGESTSFKLFLPSEDESRISEVDSTVEIHVEDRPELVEATDEKAAEDSASDYGRKLILVVDDDPKVTKVITELLSKEYRIMTAADGEEAERGVMSDMPDLILSDIDMPQMDGLELLRKLKEDEITKNIPFIFIAFKTDIENEIKAYGLGCDGFIQKPFNPKRLKAMVGGLISNRDSLKSYYTSMLSNIDTFEGKVVDSENKEFLSRLIAIIESNMTNSELSIEQLAKEMFVSKVKMHNMLKEITGKSPSEFIISVKINHATTLLKTTSLNIQEIMYDSGFNNKSYFFREFKKIHGMTPKQLRDEHQRSLPQDLLG